jgi:hypothetical protein
LRGGDSLRELTVTGWPTIAEIRTLAGWPSLTGLRLVVADDRFRRNIHENGHDCPYQGLTTGLRETVANLPGLRGLDVTILGVGTSGALARGERLVYEMPGVQTTPATVIRRVSSANVTINGVAVPAG